MNKEGETIPVGRITGVHGVRGELKVAPYGDLEEVEWETVHVVSGRFSSPFKVKRARPHKGHLIFELEGLTDRDSALALVGGEICIGRDSLPELPADEYYYRDLIGARVVTDDGRDLGRVKEIIPTGSNDVLVVQGGRGEVLIPAIESVILKVDAQEGLLTVRLLEGLLPEDREGTEKGADEV